jgi:arabinofuranan 3-O-arabinosyltransferase
VTLLHRPAVRRTLPYVGFALLCYLPLLLTRPGWISADTKSYLYIDPTRLLSRAWSMWDPQIGLGTVSHQTIGYLWPMGPWYWVFEQLGVPDWVAQRLWWGTLLFAAGTGVVFMLRRFEWPTTAIWPAAAAYALTPYVLTHIGRLSGVLLPYAGLPWMIGLTVLAIRHRSWRHPAWFALLVTTVGSVNLTALALAGLGPLLWVGYVILTRQEPPRVVAAAVGRIGLLTVGASAWWLAGLTVQASHGVDIVRYTESAEVVARTSTAFEVIRGLGYWFFYGGDKLQLWLEVSYEYTQRPWLIAVTFALPTLGLISAGLVRWRHRAYVVSLVVVGTVVAVGGHPWDDPTPFGSVTKWFVTTPRGLAFRSLPRVVPVIALGSAVLVGAGIAAAAERWPRRARAGAVAAVAVAMLGLAPLWQRSLVSDNLSRTDIPVHWLDAATVIDQRDDGTRVLELPGSDFASYRWGMTVDPITPGLTDRPYVARELVPHGAPMGTDLLNALDLRLQENTLEPAALAPIARLMRAGDLVVRSDLQFERHNIARPRVVWNLVGRAPGLGDPLGLGDPVPNEAGPILQHLDEQWLLYEGLLPDPPPVAIVPVLGSVPIVALKPAEGALLLAGDGAGVVDAAAAGLLDGTELLRYSGDLTPEEIRAELARGATLIVTDSNRRRGERWGSLRHNRGHTERLDEERLRFDPGDNRLPRFPEAPPSAQTVTIQRGGITADATAYGNPITYAGEERASRAFDGDPRTAWSVGVFSDARGERLRARLDDPLEIEWIRIQQMSPDDSNRVITEVRVTFDGEHSIDVALGPESWEAPGQAVVFPRRTIHEVELTLVADSAGDPPRFRDFGPLGIAELVLGDDAPVIDEIVRVPSHALASAGDALASAPLGFVFTRIRQDPTDRTRDDEERAVRRLFELPVARSFRIDAVVRLSARADDGVLNSVLGHVSPDVVAWATDRMDGSRTERAAAAIDGDPGTAWTTPWGQPINHSVFVEVARPQVFDRATLSLVTDGRHSVPTRVRVRVDGEERALLDLPDLPDLPEPGAVSEVSIRFPAQEGHRFELEVVAAREVTSIDWTAARPLAHPVAIAELGLPGISLGPIPERFDTGCRDDLLRIDDLPVPVRVSGTSEDALAGGKLEVETCEPEVLLAAGPHEISASRGVDTGLDLDEIVLWGEAPHDRVVEPPRGQASILASGPDHLRVQLVELEPDQPVWFVFAQSLSDGWVATIDGRDLGPSTPVDAYANGWLLEPGGPDVVIDLRFAPQQRVNTALLLSALTVVACLGLAVRPSRRPRLDAGASDPEEAQPGPPELSLTVAGAPPGTARAALAAAAVGAATALFAPLPVAVGLALAALAGGLDRRARLLVALLPPALLGLAALYVVAWQVRYGIQPGIEWVTELERAHPIALAAVLALPVHLLVDRLWQPVANVSADQPGTSLPDAPSVEKNVR